MLCSQNHTISYNYMLTYLRHTPGYSLLYNSAWNDSLDCIRWSDLPNLADTTRVCQILWRSLQSQGFF